MNIKSILKKISSGGFAIRQHRVRGFVIPTTAILIAVTTSCVKDDLYKTPHPESGAVEVTADFSSRSSDSQLPDSYTLRIGTQEQTVTGTTNLFNQLLSPDTYTLLVYNEPYGITISGTTASVETNADGTLNSSLGSLFSGTQQITVPADDTLRVTQVMKQRTRTLVLRLNLSEEDAQRIVSITSTLTGIARYVDIATGAIDQSYSGTIAPVFELKSETLADGTVQWYIEATVVLLGISGPPQTLTLKITFDDDQEETIEDDISDEIDDFNDDDDEGGDDKTPVEIDTELKLPVEAGAEGTIGDWTVVDNGNVDIH